ncbi:outer membrane beta-barrel protein [Helicobacter saguini]|nr:outer membrane beta-barrel protein [Helicobacter saguini]MWV61689.1 outer membrane beta-barrel protein [Helicobacter saguini]MWV67639.1 outer membrane beta-barrel protein [Helicobacter saguini]MWV69990.1 outer membrane beta-barrel protein [Helicobacter saguini]MWV72796.1 outer membrane beta-barrel protein [Helicobacter saguini]
MIRKRLYIGLLSLLATDILLAATREYGEDAYTEQKTKRYSFEIPAELLFTTSNFSVLGKSGFTLGVRVGGSFVDANYRGAIYKPASVVEYQLEMTAPGSENGYMGGIDIGYRLYIGDNWGLRGHLDYNFSYTNGYKRGQGFSTNNPIITTAEVSRFGHLITLNLDLFWNYGAFGIYVGLGVGYEGYTFTSKNTSRYAFQHTGTHPLDGSDTLMGSFQGGVALPLNFGISFDINQHNQISLGAKLPILAQKYNYTQSVSGTSSSALYNPTFSGEIPSFRNYIVELGYTFTF